MTAKMMDEWLDLHVTNDRICFASLFVSRYVVLSNKQPCPRELLFVLLFPGMDMDNLFLFFAFAPGSLERPTFTKWVHIHD